MQAQTWPHGWTAGRWRWIASTGLALTCFLVVAACVSTWELEPGYALRPFTPDWPTGRIESQDLLRNATIACALLGSLLAATATIRPRWTRSLWSRKSVRHAVSGILGLLVVGGAFDYFYARPGLTNRTYVHVHDSYHYLIGAKYYDEIDYPDLYHCTLAAMPADRVGSGKVRDLTRVSSRSRAKKVRTESKCRDRFSDERWREFRRDLEIYASINGWSKINRLMGDRGYNGTPTHSIVAHGLANSFALDHTSLTWSTLLDTALICALVGAAVWHLGWVPGCLFALFLWLNAADRMLMTGQSFMRYAWLATLGIGILELGARRFVAAGIWLASSAMLNVFPVVFCLGGAVPLAYESWRSRALSREFVKYAGAGCLASLVAFGVGSLGGRGLDNYESFAANMETHDPSSRFPGYGVGLKFMFVDPGPPERDAKRTPHKRRKAQFEAHRGTFTFLSWLWVGLAAWVSRRRTSAEAALLVGTTVFFCWLGTTTYYFACTSLLTLLWLPRWRQRLGQAMLATVFSINLIGMWGLLERWHYFYVFNTLVSWMIALMLGSSLLVVAWESESLGPRLRRLRSRRASSESKSGSPPAATPG